MKQFYLKSLNHFYLKIFLKKKTSVWMSHQDAVIKIPKGFENLASTDSSKYTAIQNKKKNLWYTISSRSNSYKKGFQNNKKFCFKYL